MTPVRSILVAVDFEDPSQAALQYASTLAGTHAARLHVLHVVDTVTPRGVASFHPAGLGVLQRDLENNARVRLQGLVAGLHGKMRALEQTWRDQEQRKFSEVFDQTVKSLSVFLENSHQHVSFLGKKAALIEDYLKQR